MATSTTNQDEVKDVVPDLIKLESIAKLPDNVKSMTVLGKDLVAIGTYGQNILIYDTALRQVVRTIPTAYRHIGIINKIGRDHIVASHNFANDMHIYNWRTGQHVKTINNVELCWGRENPILFSIQGKDDVLIAGQRNSNLLVFNFSSGELIKSVPTTFASVYCVLGVNEDTIAIGGVGSQNEIQLIDVNSDIKKKELVGHTAAVFCMCKVYYHVIASGGFDGTIRLWNWMTGESLHKLSGHGQTVRQVSPLFGRYIVSGGDDASVKIWDIKDVACVKTVYEHHAAVLNVGDVQGGRLISASEEKVLRVWRWRHPKDMKMMDNLNRTQLLSQFIDIALIFL
jgi:WD40 repeat protein